MPLTSWASDIVKMVGRNLADTVHQDVDGEGWRALVLAILFIFINFIHFSLFNHGSPVNLLRLLCRGPCKQTT